LVLSEEAIKCGFRLENGSVVKYLVGINGELIRKRKNWKNSARVYSRQFLKDKCEKCGSTIFLTIHHKVPLSKGGSKEEDNCITLCNDCHKLEHSHPKKDKRESILILEQGLWGEYRIIGTLNV
jgi:hypothetical protein